MGRPAPFQRPSVSLGTSEKRDWREISVYSLLAGDTVAGRGLVTLVTDHPEGIFVSFKSGNGVHYSEGDTVYAFVRL